MKGIHPVSIRKYETNKMVPGIAKYIKIKHGNKEIPLNELTIEINTDKPNVLKSYTWLLMYLDYLEEIKKVQISENWESENETKEEYIDRMLAHAEQLRFDLMLTDHSWQQYMEGWGSTESALSAISQEITNGGDYYSYVEKLDAPECEKEKLIHAYEDAYIDGMIEIKEYPGDKSRKEKNAWIEKKGSEPKLETLINTSFVNYHS